MSVETERLQQALDRAADLHSAARALVRRLGDIPTLKLAPELIGEAAKAAHAAQKLVEHLSHQLVRAQAKEALHVR